MDDYKNLSPLISDKISEIGNLLFNLNRLLDAGMDWLDIDCHMPKTSKYIHDLAHKAPIDADSFRDYNAKHGMRTDYESPIQGSKAEYLAPVEFYIHAFAYVSKILYCIIETIRLSEELEDQDSNEFLYSQIPMAVGYKDKFAFLHNETLSYLKVGKTVEEIDSIVDSFQKGG
jgi:hypothetical protein